MLPRALPSSLRAALVLVLGLAAPGLARPAEPPAAPPAPVAPAPAAAPKPIAYKPGPGPHEVARAHYDWVDAARQQRAVPVTVYAPKGGDGPFPVILFSHGLGGTRDGYAYLGRYWASYGYVVVHVQHLGSDDGVWKGKGARIGEALRQAAANPRVAAERPGDIRFVLDKLAALGDGGEPMLRGRLDLDRVGLAGHSFGAWTTLAVAGQLSILPTGREVSFADRRIKAALAMSAPAPRRKADFSLVFRNVAIPVFHMTGTRDDSPIGETQAAERRVPFDHIAGADQYLVTFRGGDHMIFSGRARSDHGGEKDAQFQDLIKMGSMAFWDAYLKGEAEAKAWLARGGFAGVLGEEGVFEKKLKP